MRGFLIIYDAGHTLLYDDEFIDSLIDKSYILNKSGSYLIDILTGKQLLHGKFIYITNNETYKKIKDLYKGDQFLLLHELYHTLKAEESIVDRENRIMELNNKITEIDESIKK